MKAGFSEGRFKKLTFPTATLMYQEVGKQGCMDPYDFSALRRELVSQGFMIHYLQEEQKKRWEELRAIEQDLEKLQADPGYQQFLNLVEKLRNEPVAEQVRERRSRAKRLAVVGLGDSHHLDSSFGAVTLSEGPYRNIPERTPVCGGGKEP